MTRTGACSSCGACCRLIALPIPRPTAWRRSGAVVEVARPEVFDGAYVGFLAARGCRVTPGSIIVPIDASDDAPARVATYAGHLVLYVRSTCPQLTDDKRCRIHDTSAFPEACRTFPRLPADLDLVGDVCSYRFEG